MWYVHTSAFVYLIDMNSQVARPVGTFKDQSDFHYHMLRCNVDMLKLIQLGLTFTDGDGHLADRKSVV